MQQYWFESQMIGVVSEEEAKRIQTEAKADGRRISQGNGYFVVRR